MAEANLNINGKNYSIHCEDGQEQRVLELGQFVDSRLKDIAQAGAASNENHLLVLTALMLADEIFDLREDSTALNSQLQSSQANQNDEASVALAIDELANRIERIAGRLQNA